MKRMLILLTLPMCLAASGCAAVSYPLPSCDGYSRRPLNRSMWDWENKTQSAGQAAKEPASSPATQPAS